MTNKEILDIALRQSAYDFNCRPEDFLKSENVITISQKSDLARRYLPLPFECDLVTYGGNIVAQTSERLMPIVEKYISRAPAYRLFETPQVIYLNEILAPYNMKVCFMAEYFLPDADRLKPLDCPFELRVLEKADLAGLYDGPWDNALTHEGRERDVLAVGAYAGERLVGLAGCSKDCETMYQIGVDVLPEYRRRGVASAITSRLAIEILRLGRVPFYCAAWSNIKSVRNAFRCGFYPAWAELTARDTEFTDKLIGRS